MSRSHDDSEGPDQDDARGTLGEAVDSDPLPGADEGERTEVGVTRSSVFRGARLTSMAQAANLVLRVGSSVVLARLLTPRDFGIVAVATVISLVLLRLKDLGTGAAVIQRDRIDDVLVNSVFYLNLVMGLALAGAIWVVAGPLADALGSPESRYVMQAFTAITVLSALAQIHHALLRRAMRWGVTAVISVSTTALNGAVAITSALLGAGFWSIVYGFIAEAVLDLIMVWVVDRWRPTLTFSLESLRSVWRYSTRLFASDVIYILFGQVDKLIVSHFLGPAPLGTYTLAQRTVTSPTTSVGSIVSEVTFPAYARKQDDKEALQSGLVRSAAVVALVILPATLGLAVLASPAVALAFGPQWNDLDTVIWILAPATALQSITSNCQDLLLAKGRSELAYRYSLLFLGVLASCELVGVHWGLDGVAVAYGVGTVLVTPVGVGLALRVISMRTRDYVRPLLVHLWMSLTMAVAVLISSVGVDRLGGGHLAQLATGTVVGVVVYAALLLWRRPPAFLDTLAMAGRRAA